ncbi:UbiA family prenyltransferase [Sedimentitalea sp.]|uniref:UbiA family prenyltransferase n=1 Tax=Sedimentitalea sp. TaxID=2048915 RepID=UPI003298A5E7
MDKKSIEAGILTVDLDGTLLRSDMLFESFWSAVGRDWRNLLQAVANLIRGKAALKRYLFRAADIDVTTLPYDAGVIERIQEWRAHGGRTALVTATDQKIADRIAEHLQLFDEVHGSDGTTNLKGPTKAKFLTDRFGVKGFVYMGDSSADLPVWNSAGYAIPVNASVALRAQVDQLGVPVDPLMTLSPTLLPYLKALRPHQWLKNILVFLPVLAAHQLTGAALFQSVLAFIAFSLVASSVYVLNDLLDLKVDRAHPRKRDRPFASGNIPIAHGTWMACGILACGIALSLLLGKEFGWAMLIYYLITFAYSINLKRRAIVDICVLAGLYTLRIIAGGAAAGIPLSVWLLAFSIFFFFALAAVKRQAELVDMAERGKLDVSGRGYHVDDLPIISMMAIGSGYVSVLIMALYVNSPAIVELYSTPAALWGICCVLLYWISRIVMVTHRGHMHDDPVVFAAKDKVSLLCLLIILAFAIAGAVV